eukprot:m.496512 g.496512  ORF g.496512 m.496512 type:complete len:92 (+) comp57305_c0_seq58:2552-2827(+)
MHFPDTDIADVRTSCRHVLFFLATRRVASGILHPRSPVSLGRNAVDFNARARAFCKSWMSIKEKGMLLCSSHSQSNTSQSLWNATLSMPIS